MFLPFHGTFFLTRGVMAGSLGSGLSIFLVGVAGSLASPLAGFVGVLGRWLSFWLAATSGCSLPVISRIGSASGVAIFASRRVRGLGFSVSMLSFPLGWRILR